MTEEKKVSSPRAVIDGEVLAELLKKAKKNSDGEWEEKFVAETNSRFKKWGSKLFMSEKQLSILKRIADGEEAEAATDTPAATKGVEDDIDF
jgi:hypothetical protein